MVCSNAQMKEAERETARVKEMGEEGLEERAKSLEKNRVSQELALNLALFDISEMWRSLDTPKRALTLHFIHCLLKPKDSEKV